MSERIKFLKAYRMIMEHLNEGRSYEQIADHFNEQTYRKPNGAKFQEADVKRIYTQGLEGFERERRRREMLEVYPSK